MTLIKDLIKIVPPLIQWEIEDALLIVSDGVLKYTPALCFPVAALRYLFQAVQTQTTTVYCRILPILDHHV